MAIFSLVFKVSTIFFSVHMIHNLNPRLIFLRTLLLRPLLYWHVSASLYELLLGQIDMFNLYLYKIRGNQMSKIMDIRNRHTCMNFVILTGQRSIS